MTKRELDRVAFATHTTKKAKGTNKGYKYTHTIVWSGAMTRKEYLDKYAEIDRHGCGIFLCKIEQDDFTTDRWWDVPSYRDEAIRDYRDRIKSIRLNYGLTKSEVSEFMRV